MKKLVKKYGSSLVIVIDKDDQKIERIKEGDVLDIVIKENLGNIQTAVLDNAN